MSVKDMINHAYSKNATEFETAFNSIMADKVEAALGAKFDSMYGAPEVAEEEPVAEVEDDIEVDSELDSEVE